MPTTSKKPMEELPPPPVSTEPANAWMLSFADLLSLILTFFVMLYAMSVIAQPKWHMIKDSLVERLNPDKKSPEVLFTAQKTITSIDVNSAMELSYLYSLVKEKMKEVPALSDLKFEQQHDSLVLQLPGDVAFVEGERELTPKATEILSLLEDILHQIGNRVDVFGYAPSSERAISISRAISVAKGLQDFGYSYQVKAFGLPNEASDKKELYGDSQRVDIVIRSENAEYEE